MGPQPKPVVPHAVDDDIPAAVAGQNPEGQKGEVAPLVAQDVAHHKDSDGGERGGECHSQSPNGPGSLDIREGGLDGGRGGVCPLDLGQVPPAPGVLSDAGKGNDVEQQCGGQQGEVEGREE